MMRGLASINSSSYLVNFCSAVECIPDCSQSSYSGPEPLPCGRFELVNRFNDHCEGH